MTTWLSSGWPRSSTISLINIASTYEHVLRKAGSDTMRKPNSGACSGASPAATRTRTVLPGYQDDSSWLTQIPIPYDCSAWAVTLNAPFLNT
jgi:hypothetical protein